MALINLAEIRRPHDIHPLAQTFEIPAVVHLHMTDQLPGPLAVTLEVVLF